MMHYEKFIHFSLKVNHITSLTTHQANVKGKVTKGMHNNRVNDLKLEITNVCSTKGWKIIALIKHPKYLSS